MIINSFKKSENEHEYIYNFTSTFELTPNIIEVMVLFLKEDMENFYLFEYSEENKDKREIVNVDELTYKGAIMVSGHDTITDTDLIIFIYPNSRHIRIIAECEFIDNYKIEEDNGEERLLSKKEKREFFCVYVDSLEIAAHTHLKAGECYSKLFMASRYYVNSNYDSELALFEEDGYMLNLEFLFSPPEKNLLPPS